MKVVFTTYRYGMIDNSVYHCEDSWADDTAGGLLHMENVVEFDNMPPGTDRCGSVVLTITAGDTWATFACDGTCATHGEAATVNQLPDDRATSP